MNTKFKFHKQRTIDKLIKNYILMFDLKKNNLHSHV